MVYYRKRAGSATTLRSEKSFQIFSSFVFTKTLYQEIGASKHENSLMHAWFLDSFYWHMVNFTPYLKWIKFYIDIVNIVKTFDFISLDLKVFGWKRLFVLKILKMPAVIGFPIYIFYKVICNQFLLKKLILFFLQLLGHILPKSILDSLLIFLQKKNQKLKFSRHWNILSKAIYFLQRKTPNGKA